MTKKPDGIGASIFVLKKLNVTFLDVSIIYGLDILVITL